MLSIHFETRILHLAQAEKLLLDPAGPGMDPTPLVRPEVVAQSSLWGPRIDGLIREGRITQAQVESLAWRLSSAVDMGDGASWTEHSQPSTLPDLDGRKAVGRFASLSYLGEGALGRVYKAFDPTLQRWVALKFLKVSIPGRDTSLLTEARAQAQVEHPNVCRVYEVGEAEGHPYIAMQWVDGQAMGNAIGKLSLVEKVRMVRDLAQGVHAAHKKGLLHLDIKPGNVLVQGVEEGGLHPLLTDFGMVSGSIQPWGNRCPMGTPPFSSPEQVAGRTDLICPQSDVYALGVTLYVLVSGAYPFRADSFVALLEAIQEQPPLPIESHGRKVPASLEAIIGRCLAKNSAQRFPTAQALSEALEGFLDEYASQRSPRWSRVAWAGVTAAIMVSLAVWMWLSRTPRGGTDQLRTAADSAQEVQDLLAQITAKELAYRNEITALAERMKRARTESERKEIEREAERLKVLRETELANLRKSAGLLQPPKAALPSLALPKDEPRSANPSGDPMAARTPARGATTTETPFVPSRKEPLVEPPANPTPQSAPEPKTSSAPAPAASAAQPVLPPVVHQSHVPNLTAEEIQRHQDARIRFAVMVDEVGSPRTIRALSCPSELIPAFTKAIQRTTFTPGQSGGQPARRWVNLTYHVRPTGLEVE